MAHIIERVCAKDLALTTLAQQNFEESVERLYLSLLKTNAAILDLGDGGWDDKLQTCLASVSPDALANGMTKRSVRGRPAIARLVNEYRLGQKGQHNWCEQEDLQQAAQRMEVYARRVLKTICRSAHVRLHSALLTGLTDDLPLRTWATASSTLRAVKYSQLAASRSPVRGTPMMASSAAAQSPSVQMVSPEGCTGQGLISIVMTLPAQHKGQDVSKLQVRTPDGTWLDVCTGPDEAAVFLGSATEQATAGVLKAATYRVVGEVHRGNGHLSLEYHLNARPSAKLDLSDALRDAGHDIPLRDAGCIASLTRQFSTLAYGLKTPMSQTQGGLERSESLEMHTMSSAELKRRTGAKRQSRSFRTEQPVQAAGSPVTRSGKVARTSAGTYVSSRLAEPTEPEEEELDVSLEMDELLCVTVDACGRASSGFMNVHFRYCSSAGGRAGQHAGVDAGEDQQTNVAEPRSADEGRRSEVVLRAHPKTCFRRLFQVFSDVLGVNLQHVKFLYGTVRLDADDQLGSLGKGYAEVLVMDVPEAMHDMSMGFVNI